MELPTLYPPASKRLEAPPTLPGQTVQQARNTFMASGVNPETLPTQPTTLSSENISTKVLPELKKNIQEASNRGLMTNESGVTTYADKTLYQQPDPEEAKRQAGGTYVDTTGVKRYNYDGTQAVEGENLLQSDPYIKAQNDILEKARIEGDAITASMIAGIQSQYSGLIEDQKRANEAMDAARSTALLLGGGSRYAPISSAGVQQAQVSYGIRQIGKLVDQENQLINEAKVAQFNRNYQLASKKMQMLEEVRQEKLTATTKASELIQKQRDEAIKVQQDVEKQIYEQITKPINELATKASEAGAPSNVVSAIANSKSIDDALKAGGSYLKKAPAATGIVGEYQYYVADEEARGRHPVSFNEYQMIDANRKIAQAKAVATSSGLSTGDANRLMQVTNKFQADAVMQVAQQATTAKSIANQALANPQNVGDQLTILYTLVKNLDPNSAVREGELSLAQSTQSYLNRFSTSLSRIEKGQVISPEATKELAKATISLADKWEQAGLRREKQYKSQAKTIGLGDAFEEYLSGIDRTYAGTGKQISNDETQAVEALKSYITEHPAKAAEIDEKIKKMEETLGRPINASEFYQANPSYR